MKVYKSPGGRVYCFVTHALERMSERRIKRVEVERTLDDYQVSYTDPDGNECFVRQLDDGRRLEVVVAKQSNPMRIITVIAEASGKGYQ